jgi:hypothetical protein
LLFESHFFMIRLLPMDQNSQGLVVLSQHNGAEIFWPEMFEATNLRPGFI